MKKILCSLLIMFSFMSCDMMEYASGYSDFHYDSRIYRLLENVEYFDFEGYELSHLHYLEEDTDAYGDIEKDHIDIIINMGYIDPNACSFDNPECLKAISDWIYEIIHYHADDEEEFTSPKIALDRGYGDCDEFTFIFMNIVYILFEVKMDMVILDTSGRTVVNGGEGTHINIAYNDVVYSAQNGVVFTNQEILYIYTFDEVFGEING